jgi:hypothetical protein
MTALPSRATFEVVAMKTAVSVPPPSPIAGVARRMLVIRETDFFVRVMQ